MKRSFLFCLLFLATFIISCKKEKKDEPNTPSEKTPYYITAKVNGVSKEFRNNINNVDDETYTQADVYLDGGKRVWYQSSMSPNKADYYFEFSFNDVQIPDGDDRDQMDEIFSEGLNQVNSTKDSAYTITWYGPGKYCYNRRYSDAAVTISIDSVSNPVSQDGKTIIQVTGSLDSIRLFEKDRDLQEYTGNYVDVTNLQFFIPFESDSR